MINAIRSHSAAPPEEQLKKQDQDGNTPLHIAAEHNRHLVLKYYRRLGADLTIINKNQETVLDVVKKRNFSRCLPYASPISTIPDVVQEQLRLSQNALSEDSCPISKQRPTTAIKDPQFVYGDMKPKPIKGTISAKEGTSNLTAHHVDAGSRPEATPKMSYPEFIAKYCSPEKAPQSQEASQSHVSKEKTPQFSKKELKIEPKREEQSQVKSRAEHTAQKTKTPTVSHQYKPTFFEQKKDNSSIPNQNQITGFRD